jgi:hypothetical protein
MKPFSAWLSLVLLAAPAAALQEPAAAPKEPTAAPQDPATPPQTAPAPQEKEQAKEGEPAAPAKTFSTEQLEQLVAPIALYPDSLLTQVLMGSTYPLEIVQAARWVQKNPKMEPDKLEAALKDQTWDPSVKSLCGFGDVLKRMNDNLDWTQDLGDAFLGQQSQVMDAVQNMRRKAYDAGNLKTSKELTVTEQPDKIIVIQAAQPEVIYVPTYYPSAVYGSWSYPYWYYPPMYPPPPAGAAWFGFTVGVIWGSAMWGGCSWGWGHTEIDIDINQQNNFIDRTESGARRDQVKDRAGTRNTAGNNKAGGKGTWQHNPEHRKGVGYKDKGVAQKYGGGGSQSLVSRDQARGFDGGASQRPTTSDRAGTGASQRPTTSDRAGTGAGSASTRDAGSRAGTSQTTGSRSSSSSRSTGSAGSSSFSGSRTPSFDRASSSRGASSRGSMGSRGGGGRGRGGRR